MKRIAHSNGGTATPQSQFPRDALLEREHGFMISGDAPFVDDTTLETRRYWPHTVVARASNQPATVFSEDEMVRLSEEWLLNEELNLGFRLLLDELVGTDPVVAKIVQELSNEVWGVQYTPSPNIRSAFICPPLENIRPAPVVMDDNLATAKPAVSFPVGFRQFRYEFPCDLCGKVYDRVNRARDCQYHDQKLTPYRCGGSCGHHACNAEYSSEERLERHISASRIQCPQCRKEVSKQNMARHRKSHCPSSKLRERDRRARRDAKMISMTVIYP